MKIRNNNYIKYVKIPIKNCTNEAKKIKIIKRDTDKNHITSDIYFIIIPILDT